LFGTTLGLESIDWGVSAKVLNQSLSNASASGFTMDTGWVLRANSNWKFGLSLYNILPTSIDWNSGGVSEKLPFKAKAGVALQCSPELLMVADVDISGFKQGGVYAGAEYWLGHWIALRGGFNRDAYSLGLGLSVSGIHLDYAYSFPPSDASYLDASTRFSLSYVFGETVASTEITPPPTETKEVNASSEAAAAEELTAPVVQTAEKI
jgi:hypothetical protein